MGLSIHYRGTLTDKRQSAALLCELEDIGKSMRWPTQVLDGHWDRRPDARLERNSAGLPALVGDSGLKGIILKVHQDCAPLYFCFSASGVLTSPIQVAVSAVDNYAVTPNWITVHTQSAGPETHAAIVSLLRYLQEKYFHDLEVEDESGYWESRDYQDVLSEMARERSGNEELARKAARLKRREQKDIVARIDLLLRKMRDWEED
ncbi:hypothetical protein [Phaeodactylibacter xiamenensis]|jgi:hypothetical protein|uniref:hypothetical protein n=1 Tax=Phaeodactylibacter xiamenensis TaxID=1524460 RepID=UPI0024A7C986|nr:hypothetical protein [Phaeodactylibacter xiamenensis]